MQALKNYLNNFRLKGFIEDALAIKELHFVKDQYFQNITNAVNLMQRNKISDMKKILKEFFHKNRLSQKLTLRLLMIVHEILRQTECFEVSQKIIEVLYDFCEVLQKIQTQKLKGIDTYLKRSFTVPYTAYLIKAYKKQSREEFRKSKLVKKQQIESLNEFNRKTTKLKQFKSMQGIQMNFTIFNLVAEILKFNSDLHQMGRYYSEHQYAINLYLEMLRDFDIYFKIIQHSFLELTHLSQSQVNQAEAQKVYLFMSQSERCVNKMNSFYYNKYLFYYINEKISLKMHLEIPQEFYPVLNLSHRRIQKRLSFDICLTATYPSHKMHQPDTKDSNRSKQNNFKKIIQSIASLNQTLEQMENIEHIQLEKNNNQQRMRRSALF